MQPPAHTRNLTFLFASLAMLGPFSIDTYFPSFVGIADHFEVTTADVQQTLTCYLAALAVMSLFHGALSDSFGRRRVVLVSLSGFVLACVGASFAPDFQALLLFRVLQGACAGSGWIVAQAMVRDLYQGHHAQKLLAQIMMLFSLAPAVAPVLGGYLHLWFGWRGPFLFLLLYGITVLTTSWRFLPETLAPERRHPFQPVATSKAYLSVLGNRRFILFCIASGCCFGGASVYVAGAPDFILNILHLKETQFGWLFVALMSGLIMGSMISHKIAGRFSKGRIILSGYTIMALAAAINLSYNLLASPAIPFATLPLGLYFMGSSIASPVITIVALDHYPNRRGMAASLTTFITLMIFTFVSGVVAPHLAGDPVAYAGFMAGMLCISLVCFFFATRNSLISLYSLESETSPGSSPVP